MSFLSILLFFSAFYFAYGRPDATAFAGGYPTESSDYSLEASTDSEDNQYENGIIAGFMDTMSEILDIYLMPLMVEIDEDKQQDLKAMAMNGCYSYIQFVMMVINESKDDQNDFGKWQQDLEDSDPSEDDSDSLPTDSEKETETDADAAEDETSESDPDADVSDESVEDQGCM